MADPETPVGSVCRLCDVPLNETFLDLGMSPLANSFLKPERLREMEPFYPLRAFVCASCMLVQLEEYESPSKIFSDYAYFSSYSMSWLAQCRTYADEMISRFDLGAESRVVEIASNDGYLLQFFQAKGIPVLGIEPAANVAEVARENGIPTHTLFFNEGSAAELVRQAYAADLLVANNVLAHVPDLHSFVSGIKIILKPAGVVTLEFQHLLQIIRHAQFDTIYHEHFSYLSLHVVEKLLSSHGLAVFDVEELPTHGGSLRVYVRHAEDHTKPLNDNVVRLRACESAAELNRLETYTAFSERVKDVKCNLLEFLIRSRRQGKRVVGYGAPAKGNTLLNYCGIGRELLPYTVDRSPHKQGLCLPGTHLPIEHPEKIRETRPDYVLILPWNFREEIAEQMSHIREWGAHFVVPIPSVEVF